MKTKKTALITGSGRGIGKAIAIQLANDGFNIVINDINQDIADSTSKEILNLNTEVHTSTHDVSKNEQAKSLAKEIEDKWGRIDVLVNNAGILRDAMLFKLEEKNWDAVIDVNLKGPFNMAQACGPLMKKNKFGRIINIASIAWLGNVGQTNYSAAKAGLIGMTRTWALELSKNGITVNAIAPGFIETDMIKAVPEEILERFRKKIPSQRLGKTDDIANLISFLSSDKASYITGQTIQIDGGLSVGLAGLF